MLYPGRALYKKTHVEVCVTIWLIGSCRDSANEGLPNPVHAGDTLEHHGDSQRTDNFRGTILMNKKLHGAIARFITPVLILTMACSLTPAIASSSSTEPGYRYDDIPTEPNESSIIAQYQAISQWSTLHLSYYFMNSNTQSEVDACEYWTNTTYQQSTGEPLEQEGPALTPQIITIQQIDSSWFISAVQFYDPAAFCS